MKVLQSITCSTSIYNIVYYIYIHHHGYVWHAIDFFAGWELERIALHPPGQCLEGVHLWTLRRITQKEEQNGRVTQDHPDPSRMHGEVNYSECGIFSCCFETLFLLWLKWGWAQMIHGDRYVLYFVLLDVYHILSILSSAFYLILTWSKDTLLGSREVWWRPRGSTDFPFDPFGVIEHSNDGNSPNKNVS